jgi:hypothetical protein
MWVSLQYFLGISPWAYFPVLVNFLNTILDSLFLSVRDFLSDIILNMSHKILRAKILDSARVRIKGSLLDFDTFLKGSKRPLIFMNVGWTFRTNERDRFNHSFLEVYEFNLKKIFLNFMVVKLFNVFKIYNDC